MPFRVELHPGSCFWLLTSRKVASPYIIHQHLQNHQYKCGLALHSTGQAGQLEAESEDQSVAIFLEYNPDEDLHDLLPGQFDDQPRPPWISRNWDHHHWTVQLPIQAPKIIRI